MNKDESNARFEKRLAFLEGRINRLEALKAEVQALKDKASVVDATLKGYYLTDYLPDDK